MTFLERLKAFNGKKAEDCSPEDFEAIENYLIYAMPALVMMAEAATDHILKCEVEGCDPCTRIYVAWTELDRMSEESL